MVLKMFERHGLGRNRFSAFAAQFWGVDAGKPDLFPGITAAGIAVVAASDEYRGKGSNQHLPASLSL